MTSVTVTPATSEIAPRFWTIGASSWSEATQASISRPWNCSSPSCAGMLPSTSPWSDSAARTMWARTAGIITSSTRLTRMRSTRAPASRAAWTAAWAGASMPPARAISCSGVRGRTRLRSRLTSGRGSSSSWPSVSIDSVAANSASRQANTVSIASEGEPVGALAQQLEDVLHVVGELGDLLEAHRRAHALERMRDPEDLLDGGLVRRVLLEPHDGEIELFEMLAGLREEHRHVLGGIHYDFR